jgi:hypothetical protein
MRLIKDLSLRHGMKEKFVSVVISEDAGKAAGEFLQYPECEGRGKITCMDHVSDLPFIEEINRFPDLRHIVVGV